MHIVTKKFIAFSDFVTNKDFSPSIWQLISDSQRFTWGDSNHSLVKALDIADFLEEESYLDNGNEEEIEFSDYLLDIVKNLRKWNGLVDLEN